jgi:putative hydrolase of the HAD superfamily
MVADVEPDRTRRFEAVLFDIGGVVTESPFEVFGRFEREQGLPEGFLRAVNSRNPQGNAWARLERGEVDFDTFRSLFREETAGLGHPVDPAGLFELLDLAVRPLLLVTLDRLRGRYRLGAVTNTFAASPTRGLPGTLAERFDVVVASTEVGLRKPDPRIYQLACERLGVAPSECVFLDDLGVNLKPARAMGMATIKVGDPVAAVAELAAVLGEPGLLDDLPAVTDEGVRGGQRAQV